MLPLSVDLASLTNSRSPATPALKATTEGRRAEGERWGRNSLSLWLCFYPPPPTHATPFQGSNF